MGLMEEFDTRVRKFGVIDVKLAQMAAMGVALVIAKLIPQLMTLSAWSFAAFALGAAGVRPLAIFSNTEFLLLTVISMTQGVVAILINARTLRRTIGVGDHT